MTIEAVLAETERWPLAEQRTLAEQLFQRVEAHEGVPPLTPELEADLEQLLQQYLADPSIARRLTGEEMIAAVLAMDEAE